MSLARGRRRPCEGGRRARFRSRGTAAPLLAHACLLLRLTNTSRCPRSCMASIKEATADKRDAEYKVAIEKCDALAGTTKDACVSSAKVQYGKS